MGKQIPPEIDKESDVDTDSESESVVQEDLGSKSLRLEKVGLETGEGDEVEQTESKVTSEPGVPDPEYRAPLKQGVPGVRIQPVQVRKPIERLGQ